MKGENELRVRQGSTCQGEGQLARPDSTADMQVNNVVAVGQQMASYRQCVGRIINSVLRRSLETREVDDIAGDSSLPQEFDKRHNMCLDTAVRGRIGPKLKDLHPRLLCFFKRTWDLG